MPRVRLSAPAQADIQNILATSLEQWGDDSMSRYATLLAAAIRTVAAQPTAPTTRARDDLIPGIRSFHIRHAPGDHGVRAPVHVVYYRMVDSALIEIARVLHERMDPTRHLDERSATPRKPRRARASGRRRR